jgi:DNA polymerase III delta subunit
MALINSEAEKLALYYHTKPPKSDEELLSHISGAPYAKNWGFYDSFLTRNADEALKILSQLQDIEADARMIFYSLQYYYAGIYFLLVHPKISPDRVPVIKTKKYALDNAANYARYWSKESISDIIAVHRGLELRLKTGESGSYAVFDALLTLIASIT